MSFRAAWLVGRISTIFAQRGSVSGMSDIGRYQTSWWTAGIVYSDDLITRSGGPNPSLTPSHWLSVTTAFGAGMSFGSPCSAPPSTQRTIVSTCSSLSDMSFLNFCTPTLRSMCQGGICRVATRSLIERAHGRASWKEMSDIGAIDPGWWHSWHFAWKIGATSFEKVTGLPASAAMAGTEIATVKAPAAALIRQV